MEVKAYKPKDNVYSEYIIQLLITYFHYVPYCNFLIVRNWKYIVGLHVSISPMHLITSGELD